MSRLGFHCHALDDFDEVILSNELLRGEFYNFLPDSIGDLSRRIERHNLAASIHAPLVRIPWYPTPPTLSFLCDVDQERRRLSLAMVEETMKTAAAFGAEYVVVHFPVSPTTSVNGLGYAQLRSIAWDSARRLAEYSQRYRVPIHMEGFGPSPFLAVDFLNEVIRSFPCLRYCFDTGHMHIASQRDGFDLYRFAEGLAPNIGSVHLWNNRSIDDYFKFGHIPVHPVQKPEDGWVSIERILRIIVPNNPGCRVILESGNHYPVSLGAHNVRDGVQWVRELTAPLF
ncbi:MAG: TIM barrel protein [Dehalococcoidia bacterium]|nr:TIM barrel protein [Dehalococcoidia bacterium]